MTPGGAPDAWNPQPASPNNGCLKACLVVGIVLVVLGIALFAAVFLFATRFATDMGLNSDGTVRACEFISNDELSGILGQDAVATPLAGIVDSTIGRVLDKRVLADAPDCWIVTDSQRSSTTGRMAELDSADAPAVFQGEKAAADSGGYWASDMSGIGDEAFCTGVSDAMSAGVLARSGNRLVYASLIIGDGGATDLQTTAGGVTTSPSTCSLAGEVARAMLP